MNTPDGRLDRIARKSLDRIAGDAAALLAVPLVLIGLIDGRRQSYLGAHGLSGPRTKTLSPLCREVATAGRRIVLPDVRQRMPVGARMLFGMEFVAYAAVPLTLQRPSRVGAMAVLSPESRAWHPRELRLLGGLADAASSVIDMRFTCEDIIGDEHRRASDELEVALASGRSRTLELEQTSLHDELTGLLNRRGLFAVAEVQLAAACQRTAGGLLLAFDLDGLKRTNDRHGHLAGDDLLRAAATVLRATFRDTDTIARLGGDEFVVLASDIGREEHSAILARLALELGRVNAGRDPQIPLRWSLGLVAIDASSAGTLESLMTVADERMYSAKRALHELVDANAAPIV